MMQVLSTWANISIPLVAGIAAWLANEWRKRATEDRSRREERYRLLLDHSRGFYEPRNPDDIDKFIAEVNLSWLYCPDSVIKALYDFLQTVHTERSVTVHVRKEAEEAFNTMVAAMRDDLRRVGPFKRTSLASTDYRHYGAAAPRSGRSAPTPPNR